MGLCAPCFQRNLIILFVHPKDVQGGKIDILWGLKKQNTVFATGKSILNKTSKINIGELMLQYGGSGHQNAGTCQIANDKADEVLKVLIEKITADG